MPAAHALRGIGRRGRAVSGRTLAPAGGAAAIGFHLRHIAGTLDRLFTYASGRSLAPGQLTVMREEGSPGSPPATADELLGSVDEAIEAALRGLREMPEADLLTPRVRGRRRLPSSVLGLLFSIDAHASRTLVP